MDKTCEFCMALRPVIYCKADAAHLCLSCDAKIHSANALSNRHSRTPLCESCQFLRAYIRCFNHQMFMCRVCHHNQHEVSSQHQKQVISSYMGCPSAKDLAALWGFDLNELNDSNLRDEFVSKSSGSVDTGVVSLDIPTQTCPNTGGSLLASKVDSVTSFFGAVSEVGLRSQHTKILDLKRLQLTEDANGSYLIRHPKQTDMSSFKRDATWKLENNLGQNLQHSSGLFSGLEQVGSPHQDLSVEPFPLPFSQLDYLTSSTVGNPLQGDPFWQCKCPVQTGQLWSQNMEDLGVCEELGCLDDLSIPDVDLTFQNFEELFGGEQEPTRALLDDQDMACSSVEKDTSLDGSDNVYAKAIEDMSVSSSIYITQSTHEDTDIGPPNKACYFSRSGNYLRSIPSSYSTLSFSLSRLSAESTGADYMDRGLSPIIFGQQLSCNSPDRENAQLQAKENGRTRYKEKKVRMQEKQVQYASRKARADVQKQGKRPIWEGRRL